VALGTGHLKQAVDVQHVSKSHDIMTYLRIADGLCRSSVPTSQTFRFGVRFEVFTAVTMKNVIFWDIKPTTLQSPVD
jgi:hypothetical protein